MATRRMPTRMFSGPTCSRRRASEAIASAGRPKGCVLQAARRSLQALGWQMSSMNTLVTDEGAVMNLAGSTPDGPPDGPAGKAMEAAIPQSTRDGGRNNLIYPEGIKLIKK